MSTITENVSSGTEKKFNAPPKSPSRQQRRYAAGRREFERLTNQYGGVSRGAHWWPAEMPRKVARQIARDAQ